MELCRSLALLTGSLGLVTILIALSTNFWFEILGPNISIHWGLWSKQFHNEVPGYIHAMQTLSILATLSGLVSVIFLILSCMPSLPIRGYGPLISSIVAFAAAIFAVVAMTVYTSEQWNQAKHPQIQTFFSWSFYLGWVSALLWLCTGSLSLGVHCSGPRPGYDTL